MAVLDWVCHYPLYPTWLIYIAYVTILQNENVNRPYTSTHKVKDLRRPDRRTSMKVLVKKSYKFVQQVWATYVCRNLANLE